MLVAAPLRWDEACFAVPAVRALIASGLGMGVLCPEEQAEFWQTITPLEVVAFPPKAKTRGIAAQIRDSWQAALLWEPGVAADAVKAAAIPRRLGPGERSLKRILTHPLGWRKNRSNTACDSIFPPSRKWASIPAIPVFSCLPT